MSKYKSPIGGSGKKTTNLFYRSGINSLLSRIEKLEHQVWCCDDNKRHIIDKTGSYTAEKADSGKVIMWSPTTDADLLTLPSATKGMNFTIILAESAHTGIANITSAGSDGSSYFWGNAFITQADAVDQFFAQGVDKSVTAADFTHLSIDSDGTTTGGMAGDIINLICVEDGSWYVDAKLTTTGTLAKGAASAVSGDFFETAAQ